MKIMKNLIRHLLYSDRHHDHFEWENIIQKDADDWRQYVQAAKNGPTVLIATSTGGHSAVTPVESLLAVALTMRGANVHFLLCDKQLPACLQATAVSDEKQFAQFGPQASICNDCFAQGLLAYQALGLPIHLYSQLVTKNELTGLRSIVDKIDHDDIKGYQENGLRIGEHAYAGVLRYYARGDLADGPHVKAIFKRYFYASLLTSGVMKRLLSQIHFDHAVFHHGIYVPQGIIGEVCRQRNVHVVNWSVAYRKQCFLFSHDDTYHHTLLSEPTRVWERMRWNSKTEEKIDTYLKSRWTGTKDWIWFHEKPQFDTQHVEKKYGINFSKKTVGLLTNVIWDAQLHYPANAFPDMLTWLMKTITYFRKRNDLQLLIRIHPAEIRGTVPSRQKVEDEIHARFPDLPANVFIIPPDCDVSTYTLMEKCNSVIIYGTKTGVELTSMGIPVIVAGEAWIKNKGITHDVRSEAEYYRILDTLPFSDRLNEGEVERAKKYAFHFFFRRMVPLRSITESESTPPYEINIERLVDMAPDKDPGLDMLCDGILNRADFIYREELY